MIQSILCILGLIGLIFLPSIITAYLEKRRRWPYDASFRFGDFSLSQESLRYLEQCNTVAADRGFRYLERQYDGKGKIYKIAYDFLISDDQRTLAIIGAGSMLKIPVAAMWFHTKLTDSSVYVTVTNQNAVEHDFSGLWRDDLITTVDFAKAFHYHLKRIEPQSCCLEPFTEDHELDDLKKLFVFRIDTMEKSGWIRIVGQDKEFWKYTIIGAIWFAVRGILTGVVRLPLSMVRGLFEKK